MKIKEEVKLDTITKNYYSCNLIKVDDNITIDFQNCKLHFKDSLIFKCGYPNEEIYIHYVYYTQESLQKYSVYQMLDSDWIKELILFNKVHQRHSDAIFNGFKHFIILFEDEVFECICTSYEITH